MFLRPINILIYMTVKYRTRRRSRPRWTGVGTRIIVVYRINSRRTWSHLRVRMTVPASRTTSTAQISPHRTHHVHSLFFSFWRRTRIIAGRGRSIRQCRLLTRFINRRSIRTGRDYGGDNAATIYLTDIRHVTRSSCR